ncbi:hypothetical protein NPIL_642091 [Nephila pilipes]|uniref:Uncharacterized protein n=1 Tax=Nephila pilipes TaxID=299642 RepID=A0A8X6PWM5_NEPPI|nr:hypothetical protein NPIL_642091 [Nephila pilipes]
MQLITCIHSLAVTVSICGILLLVWPIMLAFLGAANIGQCPANRFLPVSMAIAGFLAVVAVLFRIIKYNLLKLEDDTLDRKLKYVRMGIDSAFLSSFVIYSWILYSLEPSHDQFREDYCNDVLYNFSLKANDYSLAFLLAHVFKKILYYIMYLFQKDP